MFELDLPELSICDRSGVIFYTDEPLFEKTGVRIAFTSKRNGASEGVYRGLNLGSHVGDDIEKVRANREIALDALGATARTELICPNQVHGDEVVIVASNAEEDLICARELAQAGSDSLIVTCPDVCAMLCYADCVPVILVESSGGFAVVHAGWRGAVAKICAKSLKKLCEVSGASPDSINIYIGPYIHEECFEVGHDTYGEFANAFPDEGGSICKDGERIDLGASIRYQLEKAGASQSRICDIDICTMCNSTDFYSYRAAGGQCGRHGAIAFRS